MGFLDGATVTAHKCDIGQYAEEGIQFDVDITAVRDDDGWTWNWKSKRKNSSPAAMPELHANPNLGGLIAMLNREHAQSATEQAERKDQGQEHRPDQDGAA